MRESLDALLTEEGSTSEYLYGYQATYDGLFTDCIMLQEAIYENHCGAMEAAMAIYRTEINPSLWTPLASLVGYLERSGAPQVSYARYWHGYLVLLKPLLMIFNYQELKILNLIVIGLLLFGVLTELVELGKKKQAAAFFLMFLMLIPISMIYSLSQSICGIIMLAASWIVVKWRIFLQKKSHMIWFFLLLGCLTSFFDFLTYPLITLGIPLVLVMITSDTAKRLYSVCLWSLSWAVGYVIFWGEKWVIGSIILRRDVLREATETIAYRAGYEEQGNYLTRLMQTVIANIREYQGRTFRILLLGIIIWLGAELVLAAHDHRLTIKREMCKSDATFLAVAILPFIWFMGTTNHSLEHPYLAFRILSIAQLALMMLVLEHVKE